MSEPLSPEEKKALLRLAREAIVAAVQQQELAQPALDDLPPALRRPGTCFVTLTQHGDLRGCIGGLEADQPLALDVQKHAAQTALFDYRFGPVTTAELDDIEIEISVLTEPQPLAYQDAADLLGRLRPGIDGVILSGGGRRATFLPQVWERLPDPVDFLNLLCLKMEAPEDEWRQGRLEVRTYQAEKFTEREFARG